MIDSAEWEQQRKRKYYQENRDRILAAAKKRAAARTPEEREAHNAYQREYRNRPENVGRYRKSCRDYYYANHDARKAYAREYMRKRRAEQKKKEGEAQCQS